MPSEIGTSIIYSRRYACTSTTNVAVVNTMDYVADYPFVITLSAGPTTPKMQTATLAQAPIYGSSIVFFPHLYHISLYHQIRGQHDIALTKMSSNDIKPNMAALSGQIGHDGRYRSL
ncbi:hypothetical protein FRC03_007262 [Tulasnella sp. 419]|nr:hypothetical protein FRC03_007262 [Tulasnella sp. 419]